MKNPSAKNAAAQSGLFLTGCGLFVFAITTLWAVCFVPMNMDEAGIYHVLACVSYPFAPLQTFRDSCLHQTTLTLPILDLDIVQSQRYTGLLPSILYAPFYYLFHAPGIQYAFGLCFLLGFAFLLSRETRKPLLSLSLFLAFFPFVFQFIHDTGPVKFALLAFPLSALLFRKILRAPAPVSYAYAAVLALLLIAATEDKPFFLYLLPSLGFFALALAGYGNLRDLAGAMIKARAPLAVAAIFTIFGLLLILLSVNQDGNYYLSWLMDIRNEEPARAPWLDLLTDFLFYWPSYAHYFYVTPDDTSDALTLQLATALLFGAWIAGAAKIRFWKYGAGLRSGLLILSFASTVIIFGIAGNAWAGHHFVFLWVPLILLIADLAAALSRGVVMILLTGFFALNLCTVAELTQATIQVRNSGERAAIFHYFADDARASNAIINFSTWGGYYIQALYGPKNQLVTYTDPLTPDDAERLLALSHETGRKIYDVCFGLNCDAATLKSLFGGKLDFTDALTGLPYWRVFVAK